MEKITEYVPVGSEADAKALENLLGNIDGVTYTRQTTGEGIAPLIVLAIVGGAAAVAGAISYWHETRVGGQVIDLTPNANPWLYRTKGLVYGLVVIKAADGTVKVDVKEPKDFFLKVVQSVITAVQNMGTTTVSGIKDVAVAAVGNKAAVEISNDPVPPPTT